MGKPNKGHHPLRKFVIAGAWFYIVLFVMASACLGITLLFWAPVMFVTGTTLLAFAHDFGKGDVPPRRAMPADSGGDGH